MNKLIHWVKNLFLNKPLEALENKILALENEIARREQIEHQLKANIEKKKAIFNAQPDAMVITNTQGMIVMANKQMETLLGYTGEELVGQPLKILIPSRFHTQHQQLRESYQINPYPRLMGRGTATVLGLHKEQYEISLQISLSPIKTELGMLFAAALRDITESKQFELKLKASEERFRLMANNSLLMIWITDEKGSPTFSNQAWFDFVGIASSSIVTHKEWRKLVHPDDLTFIFNNYYTNIQARIPISSEYRLLHVSGEWRWVLDQAVPLFNESNIFTGYIGSLIDITQRKKIENELRVAAIAFESNEAMVITDANTVVLQINTAFTNLTGYSTEESVGKKMSFLHSGYHDDAFYKTMWESIYRNGSWAGEIWDRRKNGEVYPKWLTITAVKDDNNVITHYVGTQSDISERKAHEQKMHNLANYDWLTQLPNRRLLHERIEHAIILSQRQNKQLAVLMLDLDRFKNVNDSFGHLAGDELLQQVALRLSANLREADTVGRLGGDEFVILLENIVHLNDVTLVAKNIVIELNIPFNLKQSDHVQIGASVGISLYPQHGKTSAQLIANADIALYEAKNNGRNNFAYFAQ